MFWSRSLCEFFWTATGSDVQSWWLYSVDYDYISTIGGIAQCFHPATRSSPPDIGAYAY